MASSRPNIVLFWARKRGKEITVTKENAYEILTAFGGTTKDRGLPLAYRFNMLREPLQIKGLAMVKEACNLLGLPLPTNFEAVKKQAERYLIEYKKEYADKRIKRKLEKKRKLKNVRARKIFKTKNKPHKLKG